jgi:hypothetical protein
MRRILFGFTLLSLACCPAMAAEASYSLADGRFQFAVPEGWTSVAQELRGQRQYLGFLANDAPGAVGSKIQVGLFSFCFDQAPAVEGFMHRLKEESSDQFRFRLKWDGQALGRYQGYFYTAQPWREEFFIADYYLPAGECGLQVRFAVPSRGSEIGGFEGAMTRFLEAVQVAGQNESPNPTH